MTQDEICSGFLKLLAEFESAKNTFYGASPVVNSKFTTNFGGVSRGNPTEGEVSESLDAEQARTHALRRMHEFVKLHA
jgi:hypothetical protein